ncbi:MAG TPA: hypothetical protein VKF28_00485 [Candidatus Dormibacteraeota bacterium]|nr:hypothetical protein [Candidatus Dormibacteraeota bacterium]
MNKRPGHVDVTTDVAYCSFCNRTRTLRREAHHLGTLVRTIVTCETCHRTLSSSIGVAQAEPATAEEPALVEAVAPKVTAKAKTAPARRVPAKPATAKKPVGKAKAAAKRSGKPTSTANRKVTKRK